MFRQGAYFVERALPKKILSTSLRTSLIITGSFSRGNAGRDGDLWGGTGASVLPPT
jgi:hypothetical protein